MANQYTAAEEKALRSGANMDDINKVRIRNGMSAYTEVPISAPPKRNIPYGQEFATQPIPASSPRSVGALARAEQERRLAANASRPPATKKPTTASSPRSVGALARAEQERRLAANASRPPATAGATGGGRRTGPQLSTSRDIPALLANTFGVEPNPNATGRSARAQQLSASRTPAATPAGPVGRGYSRGATPPAAGTPPPSTPPADTTGVGTTGVGTVALDTSRIVDANPEVDVRTLGIGQGYAVSPHGQYKRQDGGVDTVHRVDYAPNADGTKRAPLYTNAYDIGGIAGLQGAATRTGPGMTVIDNSAVRQAALQRSLTGVGPNGGSMLQGGGPYLARTGSSRNDIDKELAALQTRLTSTRGTSPSATQARNAIRDRIDYLQQLSLGAQSEAGANYRASAQNATSQRIAASNQAGDQARFAAEQLAEYDRLTAEQQAEADKQRLADSLKSLDTMIGMMDSFEGQQALEASGWPKETWPQIIDTHLQLSGLNLGSGEGYADGGYIEGYADGGYIEGYAMGGPVQAITPYGGTPSMQDMDPVLKQYGQYVSTATDNNVKPVSLNEFIDLMAKGREMVQQYTTAAPQVGFANGGAVDVDGHQVIDPAMGTDGGGTDTIPAVIDGHRPAALDSGEFVIPANVVKAKGTEFFERLIAQYDEQGQKRQAIQTR